MFLGTSEHKLDVKHRVFVPKRFQQALRRDPEGNLNVVVTRGFESCLFLFSDEDFRRILKRLQTQAFGGDQLRKMQRLFFANAVHCQLDGSGRLILPESLRNTAGIAREVVMVGVADRAEIWGKEQWADYVQNNEGEFDQLDTVLFGNQGGEAAGGS